MQSIALSLFVVFLYGGIVWGLFPIDFKISFEGHLMGAFSGTVVAFYYRKVDLPPAVELDEEEDEELDTPQQDTIVIKYIQPEEHEKK